MMIALRVTVLFGMIVAVGCGASASAGTLCSLGEVLAAPDGVSVATYGMVERSAENYVFLRGSGTKSALPVYGLEADRYWSLLVTGVTGTVSGHRVLVASSAYVLVDPRHSNRPIPPLPGTLALLWPYTKDVPVVATNGAIPPPPEPGPALLDALTAQSGTIAWAKLQDDGDPVELPAEGPGPVVTTVLREQATGDLEWFYIEEQDRSCGVMVVPEESMKPWLPVVAGEVVKVRGIVHRSATDAESWIEASSVVTIGAKYVGPVGVPGRSTAACEFGLQPTTYLDTIAQSPVAGSGLNGVGLSVRIWGRVTSTRTQTSPARKTYYVDDGSKLKCTTGSVERAGIGVIYSTDCDPNYQVDDYIAVTGALGAEWSDEELPVPVVRMPCPGPPGEDCPIRVKWNSTGTPDGRTWATAYQTIQAGIDAAYTRGCTEVWVAGNSNNPYQEMVTLKSGIFVYGGFAGWETLREQRDWIANETIIERPSATLGSVVTADSLTARAGIDGFTIQNGYESQGGGVYCLDSDLTIANNRIGPNHATSDGAGIYCSGADAKVNIWSNTIGGDEAAVGNRADYSGGGIYCLNCAAEIVGNKIKHNEAGGHGGGISCEGSPTPDVRENEISKNNAEEGGGIACPGNSPSITGNVVSENTAISWGGGVYCNGGDPTLTQNQILQNTAGSFGGGIYGANGAPTITQNIISFNSVAGGEGGGIGCDIHCPAHITRNRFEGNDGCDHGGAITLEEGSDADIANNLFIENYVGGTTGGGAINAWYSSPTIINNTFVGNTASGARGGAVLLRRDGYGLLINNIFSGNVAASGNSVAATDAGSGSVSYCLAYPGDGDANYYAETGSALDWSSTTNLYTAPLFCGAGNGAYWLQAGSPARDTGLVGSPVPDVDKDGRPRPGTDGTTDIGAYEDNPACE